MMRSSYKADQTYSIHLPNLNKMRLIEVKSYHFSLTVVKTLPDLNEKELEDLALHARNSCESL